MKRFAFFLPQFHEIPENNKWWGEGFTEWTNVRKAKPLYDGHTQPKEPLDGYYNLLDKKTVVHQTELMHNYNINGMVYYHYYFCGKKLLNKPAENLLRWKDVDQKFFFCWANHSWIKSQNGKKTILQEQKYGNKKEWEEHFAYLLPFFKDARYEKKNDKPILMIFKPDFEEKNAMMEFFDEKCKENGFAGIFIINTCFSLEDYRRFKMCNQNISYEQAYFFREPACCQNLANTFWRKVKNKMRSGAIRKYDGGKLLKKMTRKVVYGKDAYHGIFFEWDNTPRHGKFGYVINPVSRKSFNEYYEAIKNDEYTFINAWNEWAEGMVLEGTKRDGYKYLEWLKELSDGEK